MRPSSWLRPYPTRTRPRARLVAFHYAGGSAGLFRPWAESLPGDLELVAVQLPGREQRMREPLFRDATALTEVLTEKLRPWFDLPVAFFGHSMGAQLAYQVARELQRHAQPLPVHLFLSGCRALHLPDPAPSISELPHDELVQHLRDLGGTPVEVLEHQELLELVLPVLRADFAVCESYRHRAEPPLPIPVTAFGGAEDRLVPAADVEAWAEQTTSRFACRIFSGDHFFLHEARPEIVATMAAEL